MRNNTDNIVMKRAIYGFCLNMGEWFYEGQYVNIKDKKLGNLMNVQITAVSDACDYVVVLDKTGKSYRISLTKVLEVTSAEEYVQIAK